MNIHQIIECDTANGSGQRVTVFVSGCRKNCPECHNKPGQDFSCGYPMDDKLIDQIFQPIRDYGIWYEGLTIMGGDPDEIENQNPVLYLIKRFKKEFPDKTIWMYTGDVFEDIRPGGPLNTPELSEILRNIDVLVDGCFIIALKDIRLNFRGSSNQRIIDVKQSLETGSVVEMIQYYNTPGDKKE
jgi:anaerobic ribonucleoside-triphosphate reductase activating protein